MHTICIMSMIMPRAWNSVKIAVFFLHKKNYITKITQQLKTKENSCNLLLMDADCRNAQQISMSWRITAYSLPLPLYLAPCVSVHIHLCYIYLYMPLFLSLFPCISFHISQGMPLSLSISSYA